MRRLHRPVLPQAGAIPALRRVKVWYALTYSPKAGVNVALPMRALIVAGSRVQHGRGPYARRARYQGQGDQCNPRGRGQR